jgi:hypothetical protein
VPLTEGFELRIEKVDGQAVGTYWHASTRKKVAGWFCVPAITCDGFIVAYLPPNPKYIEAEFCRLDEIDELPGVLRKAGCPVYDETLVIGMLAGMVPRRFDLITSI